MTRTDEQIVQLVRDHWHLAEHETRRTWAPTSVMYDDAISAGLEELWRSARMWDGEGRFGGFARQRIRWRIIDAARQSGWYHRYRRGQERPVSVDLLYDTGEEPSDHSMVTVDEIDLRDHYRGVVKGLRDGVDALPNPRLRLIVDRLIAGRTKAEIACELGVHPSYVSQLLPSIRPSAARALRKAEA